MDLLQLPPIPSLICKRLGKITAGGGAKIGAQAIAEINCTMRIVIVCEDGYVYGDGMLTSYIEEDLNRNCRIDLYDLKILINRWLETGCAGPQTCSGADFDDSTTVSMLDFVLFAQRWLTNVQ